MPQAANAASSHVSSAQLQLASAKDNQYKNLKAILHLHKQPSTHLFLVG
jgi:hypothetical protein